MSDSFLGWSNVSELQTVLDAEHFHHFVAEVVDDFYGDAAGFGLGEGAGHVAVEAVPGFFVDFGFQGRFQGFVGVVGT